MGIYASITKSWCQHYKLNYNVTLDVIIDEQIWMINVVANLVKRAYDRFETNYFVLLSTSEISKFREYGSTETWMKLQRQSCRLKISFTANRNDQAPKTIQKTVLNLITLHIRMWNLNEKNHYSTWAITTNDSDFEISANKFDFLTNIVWTAHADL